MNRWSLRRVRPGLAWFWLGEYHLARWLRMRQASAAKFIVRLDGSPPFDGYIRLMIVAGMQDEALFVMKLAKWSSEGSKVMLERACWEVDVCKRELRRHLGFEERR